MIDRPTLEEAWSEWVNEKQVDARLKKWFTYVDVRDGEPIGFNASRYKTMRVRVQYEQPAPEALQ